MGYNMNLGGYLIGYKIELDHKISNGKGGFQQHKWETIRLDFPNAPKDVQKKLKLAAQRFILTLNEQYVVLVSEVLDGLAQESEKFEVGEYL